MAQVQSILFASLAASLRLHRDVWKAMAETLNRCGRPRREGQQSNWPEPAAETEQHHQMVFSPCM